MTFPLSFYSIPLMLAAAFIIPAVSRKRGKLAPFIAVSASFISLLLSIVTMLDLMGSGILTHQMEGWPAPLGITIAVDNLNMVFILLTNLIAFLTLLFSTRYIRDRKTQYYSLSCLLLVGLLGVVHTGDMFNLFVFFEITAISSYLLVAFEKNVKSFEASLKYLIMNSFATYLILAGVAFLYAVSGTLNMADMAVKILGLSSPIIPVAFGMIIAGSLLKAGFMPFHTWLPDAHPAAPAPTSALLSSVVIGIGMYTILRMFTMFSAPALAFTMLMVLGLASMVGGAAAALMQTDLKRMLAYSSISQMGFVGLALGLGTQTGAIGGIFHLINHTIIKCLLFLCSGAVIYYAGTCDMSKIKSGFSPLLRYVFLIGVLSLAGVPLFSGFSSEWIIYLATLNVFPVLTVVAVLTSVLTLAYGLKAYYLIFLSNKAAGAKPRPLPLSMSIPLVILAAACIILGIFPQIGVQLAEFVVRGFENTLYIAGVLV